MGYTRTTGRVPPRRRGARDIPGTTTDYDSERIPIPIPFPFLFLFFEPHERPYSHAHRPKQRAIRSGHDSDARASASKRSRDLPTRAIAWVGACDTVRPHVAVATRSVARHPTLDAARARRRRTPRRARSTHRAPLARELRTRARASLERIEDGTDDIETRGHRVALSIGCERRSGRCRAR